MAATLYPCTYELVRDGQIVSTGHITLERPPVAGGEVVLGGERLVIESLWPSGGGEMRLRLVSPR